MLIKIFVCFIMMIASHLTRAEEKPQVIPSALQSVTIYRTGAEMTHKTSASLVSGNQDLIIENVSNAIDINSIQVNCAAAVTIMGTEFSHNFLLVPEVSSRIRVLRDSAASIQRDIDRVNVRILTTSDLLEVLKANRSIKGEQSGLSVAELARLMDYYEKKSIELQNALVELRDRNKKFNDQLQKIMEQIREEESKNTRKGGQLKLQLFVATPGKYDFTISYITPNAWWSPYYDIRVDGIKKPLKVIYKAKLSQATGIDWKKIKLSLSTSIPSQWGSAPILNAWFLGYINPVRAMEKDLALSNSIQSLDEVVVTGNAGNSSNIKIRGNSTLSGSNQPLYVVNGVPMSPEDFSRIDPSSIRSTTVLKNAEATALYGSRASNGVVMVTLKEGLEDYVSISDNELDITFDIDLPYDLASNGKQQTATLKEMNIDAVYKYYSVPKLDKEAYLLAEVPSWEGLNLLPGEANIVFEGTWVGKSFIDPSSTADTLNLTLGRDKRVVVKREKIVDYSSVKFLGSNKLQEFTYEITVRNNKKDSVRMLLKDQYPLSTSKDIEVELNETGTAMVNKEIGVLTWKLDLAPGEIRKVRFSYSVKYPRDRTLNL